MKTYLQDFQLFSEDEPIYSFFRKANIGERSLHTLYLSPDAAGKMLTLRVNSPFGASADKDQLGSVLLGKKNDVLSKLLWDNLYALVFLIFSSVFSPILLPLY